MYLFVVLFKMRSVKLKKLKQLHLMDVEVPKDLSHLTLDVICQSSFGYNCSGCGRYKKLVYFVTIFLRHFCVCMQRFLTYELKH